MQIKTVIIDPNINEIIETFTYNHCDRDARRNMAKLVRQAHMEGNIIISANTIHPKIKADIQGVVADLFSDDEFPVKHENVA